MERGGQARGVDRSPLGGACFADALAAALVAGSAASAERGSHSTFRPRLTPHGAIEFVSRKGEGQ